MDIKSLVNITSRAWSLRILALMSAGVPGRQAPLLAATDASRTSFAASLDHLVTLGLLERNPGHGHPLRPEFRLTQEGALAAETASKIIASVPDNDEFVLVQRTWTVPILALTAAPRRFSAIKSSLAPITDRALSKSLFLLEERDWLRRDIAISQRAPHPLYRAVNAGKRINRAVALGS